MNLVRKHFPERFEALARLEREIGGTCLKGLYLDELDPNAGRKHEEINIDCGILCEINYRENIRNSCESIYEVVNESRFNRC